jgi:hypothetical protein
MVWNFESFIPRDLHILKEFESKLLSTISEEKNDKAIA